MFFFALHEKKQKQQASKRKLMNNFNGQFIKVRTLNGKEKKERKQNYSKYLSMQQQHETINSFL